VLVLTGLAAVVFLVGRGAAGGDSGASETPAPVIHTATRTTSGPAQTHVATPKPAPRQASGLPPRIDHALRYGKVVVVSVGIPGAAVDAEVRSEARTAAKASHVRFIPLSALNARAMSALMAKTGVLPDPAVVVVKRPGTVVATFSVTDAATVAQAVAEARR
jgi:hypothetical protein